MNEVAEKCNFMISPDTSENENAANRFMCFARMRLLRHWRQVKDICCCHRFDHMTCCVILRVLPFVIDATVQFSISCETRVHQTHRTRKTLQTSLVVKCVDDAHNVLIADWSTTCTAKCCRRWCKCIRWHRQSIAAVVIVMMIVVAAACGWHRWQ